MKIAEGSKCEIEVICAPKSGKVFICQDNDAIAIHIDDIPELIKELERISKGE